MTRQGGHHAAVKSTSTGRSASSTAAVKPSSVTVGIWVMPSRVERPGARTSRIRDGGQWRRARRLQRRSSTWISAPARRSGSKTGAQSPSGSASRSRSSPPSRIGNATATARRAGTRPRRARRRAACSAPVERLRPPRAECEQRVDQPQLARVARARQGAVAQLAEQRGAAVPVDRPAVVGVDERERLQLVALVEVGHARHGELERGLAQPVQLADDREPLGERLERRAERPVVVERPRVRRHARLVLRVRRHPARRALGLAHRLLQVPRQPLGLQRPGAGERLEDQVLLDRVGHPVLAQRRAQLAPRAHARDPLVGSSASAPSRARTSPERFVSWVWRARAGCAGSGARAPRCRRGTSRRRSRSGSGRRRRRSARAAAGSGRRRCPRRPSPSPAASSAGSG